MKQLLSIVCATMLICTIGANQTPTLEGFNAQAAFIAPTTEINGEVYVILAREIGGSDKGTYDAFGGKVDPSDNNDPLNTAAREFFEEGITSATLDMQFSQVRSYIDLAAPNTEYVFAVDDTYRNVLVISSFAYGLISYFMGTFRTAYKNAPWGQGHHEKDALASVKMKDLLAAVARSSSSKNVQVKAAVTDLEGNSVSQLISLRPVFVKCLRGFAKGLSYTVGVDPRIRFYQWNGGA